MKKFLKSIISFFNSLFSNSSSPLSAKLSFIYGNFNGSKAVEDPNVQIADFKMDGRGMSFKWLKGMSAWGYGNADPNGVACAFYYDEASKSWKGGKFEWISTSRITREWSNIKSKYAGWDYGVFMAAKKHGFCVVSEDGKKRTNLITD